MPPPPAMQFTRPYLARGPATARTVLEFFVDYQCPFSRKAWPVVTALPDTIPNLRVVVRPFVLFTHEQALLMHKAGAAVGRVAPDAYFPFMESLFAAQESFYGAATKDKTRTEVRNMLADIAAGHGVDADALHELLDDDATVLHVKETQRRGMACGVWSTPTMVINGTEVPSLGSSTTPEEWAKYLAPLVAEE